MAPLQCLHIYRHNCRASRAALAAGYTPDMHHATRLEELLYLAATHTCGVRKAA